MSNNETNACNIFDTFLDNFIIKRKLFLYDKFKESTVKDENIKNVIEKLSNVDESKADFKTKISKQLKEYEQNSNEKNIFRHIVWLWALPCTDIKTWKRELNVFDDDKDFKVKDEFSKIPGIASGGLYYLTNKFFELFYLLKLMEKLLKEEYKDKEEAKKKIEEIIIKDEFKDDGTLQGKSLGVKNLLLHLCAPEDYPPITSNSHRKTIVEIFDFLIEENASEKDTSEENSLEKECIKCSKILKIFKDKNLDVWQPPLSYIWRDSSEKDFSEENALKYKKAIILYGPPGTSKTYSADRIAKALIFQDKTSKEKLKNCSLNEIDNIWKNKIHRLQLHANYTYEDFIWGYQIEKDTSKPKKGYLLKLIDTINNNKEKTPHILILDEINRVDLSRIFGELFSAIENRDQEIELPVEVEGTKKIKIPENLYFIGTMNEIDFSLEQVDFALRRRFVWFFKGFDKNILLEILNNKIKQIETNSQPKDEEIEDYIEKCDEVNKIIKKEPNLGEQYEIGHTFFAEVIDIYLSLEKKSLNTATEILWNISIKPMIQAYLGNLDKDTQKETIKEIEGKFLGKKQTKEK
mgnify:CR=1 FL=1